MSDQLKGQEPGLYNIGKSFAVKFGTMHPLKGPVAGSEEKGRIVIYSWDYVDVCMWEQCKAHDKCVFYIKRTEPTGGQCKVMHWFLKGVAVTFFNGQQTGIDVWRVGMHLMPLYRVYCKLLIAEVADPIAIYTDKQGRKQINPLYKQITDMADKISREVSKLEKQGLISPGNAPPLSIDEHFSRPKMIMRNRPVKIKEPGKAGRPRNPVKAKKRVKRR